MQAIQDPNINAEFVFLKNNQNTQKHVSIVSQKMLKSLFLSGIYKNAIISKKLFFSGKEEKMMI